MEEKVDYMSERALCMYESGKKEWLKGLRTPSNASTILRNLYKYLSSWEHGGLVVKDSFVSSELGFIQKLVKDCHFLMCQALSPSKIVENSEKKANSLEFAFFVANIESFEYRKYNNSNYMPFKNDCGALTFILSFNLNKKFIRLEVMNKENGNKLMLMDQVFGIFKFYDLKIDVVNHSLEWVNVSVVKKKHVFNHWKAIMEDDDELHYGFNSLKSFSGGLGIPTDDNECGACGFEHKDTLPSSENIPPFVEPLGYIFKHLSFYDRVKLPSSLSGFGQSLFHVFCLSLNSGVAKTKADHDCWNHCCQYLFQYYQTEMIEYLSMLDGNEKGKGKGKGKGSNKFKKIRYELLSESKIFQNNEKGKELIALDITLVDHILSSMHSSCFYLGRFLGQFCKGFTLNGDKSMTKAFDLASRMSDSGKERCDAIVETSTIGEFLRLCSNDCNWWKHISRENLLLKAIDSFVNMSNCGVSNKLNDKQVEMIESGLDSFIKIAIKNGFGQIFDNFVNQLKIIKFNIDGLTMKVLFFVLLFDQYYQSEQFKKLIQLFMKESLALCKNNNNNNDIGKDISKWVVRYILSNIEIYYDSMPANNETQQNAKNEILSIMGDIKTAAANSENKNDKAPSDADWGDA